MKPFGKKKASKVTFKTHRKHRLPKEEEKKFPQGNISGMKPEDILNK